MSKYYSNILKSIIMPAADYAMKTKIMFYYNQISHMRYWSKNEISNWHNDLMQKLIRHAYDNTEYYNTVLNDIGIKPDDIRNIENLKIIPPLTKKDIRENFDKLIPKNIDSIPHIKSSTGGSTGNPVKFLLDKNSWSFTNANNIINWEKTGYKYGEKYIALGSTSLFVNKSKSFKHLIYYKFKNKIGLNGINMSDEVCESYIRLIKQKKIKYIYGYASAIFLLAKYIIKNKVDIKILSCFPTSEILTEHYRDTINQAFDCKILNSYGATDGGITAFEAEKGFFEIGYNSVVWLKGKNNCGTALLTDLLNSAMPFINYQLGDELEIDEEKNKNYSYNGQVINRIFGRTSDVIRLENGRFLTGPGFTILFKDLPVELYSIKKDGYNSLLCNIKKQSHYNKEHENLIISTLKKQAGTETKISIKYLDEFELTKSGKRRYFIAK